MIWAKYFLAFAMLVNTSVAPAYASTSAPVQNMGILMDGLKEVAKNLKPEDGKSNLETVLATQQGLIAAIAQEGAGLNPDDFKEFLFESMERYVAHPEERTSIYAVWKFIGGYIAPELASYDTQLWQPIAEGLGNWMMVFLLLRSPTQYLLKRAGQPAMLDSLANSTGTGRLLSRIGINNELHQALVLSGMGAATIGVMQRLFANSGAHKIDPVPVMEALQIFVGCDLMYAATEKDLNADSIMKMLTQESELKEQFSDLSQLNPNDPRVKQILASVPKEAKWVNLTGQKLKCDDAVSLDHLDRYLKHRLLTMEPKK